MFSSAEKTKNVTVKRQQQMAGQTFFRKAGEGTFWGSTESSSFFSPVIQAKLSVSSPDDPQEKEADAVAETVMRMPAPVAAVPHKEEENKLQPKEDEEEKVDAKQQLPAISVQRKCDDCEKEEKVQHKLFRTIQRSEEVMAAGDESETNIQRKHISRYRSGTLQQNGRGPPIVTIQPSFEHSLSSSKGGGESLQPSTQQFMESRFNADFSGVRIHTGSTAENLNSSINAQAFTHGNDIYFNSGKYSPGTGAGDTLLAHELTHTIQQGAGTTNSAQRKIAPHTISKGFPYHLLNKVNPAAGKSPAKQNNKPKGLLIPVPGGPLKSPDPVGATVSSRNNQPKGDIRPIAKNAGSEAEIKNRIDGNAEEIKAIVHSPTGPKKDPDFQKEKKSIVHESVKQKKHHATANTKRVEAEKASALSPNEQISQDAKEINTALIETVAQKQTSPEKKFSAATFKKSLKDLINAKKPRTEEAAKEMARNPPVEDIAENFSAGVAKEQSGITKPLEDKALPDPPGGEARKVSADLPKPVPPPVPKHVNSQSVIPKPKTNEEISGKKESDRVDNAMSENKLIDDQLTESREPEFIETYKVKEAAKQKAIETPEEYRKKEEGILENAEAKAAATAATQLHGLANKNKTSGSDVLASQGATETKTEKRQREIKEAIEGIYNLTVVGVKFILQTMTDKVKTDFTKSLKEKTDIFNANLRSRISSYYGSWRIDDDLFGPDPVVVNDDGTTRSLTGEELSDMLFKGKTKGIINPDVYRIFVSEKDIFTQAMDIELDAIAANVEQGLMNAHNAIKAGEQMIANFKSTLTGNELIYANQLEEEVKMKFQNLETSIDEAKDDLLNTLADEYKDNLKAMEKSFKDINDELKKSWIDRAIEFIVTVAKTIYQLVDLIVSILVRLASIIWSIIRHPIRFFETLVKGLMEGIADFIENIGTNLKESFLTWITGAIPGGAAKLTLGSGVEGLFKLVLNVLQLGPEDLKKVAEKVLGKEFMQMIDKVMDTINKGIEIGAKILEPVIILFTQGPAALWVYIKEHVQEFIQSAFDRIKETVFFAFVEKGIKYIAGFFIPGGGFVKIVKAILSAFQFVADNMENIRHFFDAIFDSMEEAIAGNTSGVKNKVIMGLKMGVVMALDFLAKLLGLDKIIDSVHKIIQSIKTAILKAVEFILVKIKPYVLAVVKKIKDLYQKGKEAVAGAGRKVLGWLGLKKKFNDNNGGTHSIYFTGTGAAAQLTVASYNPKTIKTLLKAVSSVINLPANAAHRQSYQDVVTLNDEVDQIKGKLNNPSNPNLTQDTETMNQKLTLLATKLPPFMTMVGGTEPPPLVKPSFTNGAKASGFEVSYLKSGRTSGGSGANTNSGATLPGWPKINQAKLSAGSAWVKMHLLTEQLGGPAFDSNLTPANGPQTNTVAYNQVEKKAIDAVADGKTIWYKIDIGYHGSPDDDYANLITIEFGPHQFNSDSNQWERKDRGSTIDGKPVGAIFNQSPSKPDFSGAGGLPNLNDTTVGRVVIQNLVTGLSRPFAEFVQAVRSMGSFSDGNDLESKLVAAHAQRVVKIDNFSAQVTALRTGYNKRYSLQ